jgi:hypothetical protein
MLALDIPIGPGFGRDRVRSGAAFVLEKIAYSEVRSEYGLARSRAAGFFTVASGTFALGFFPL